ncbi:polyphosphate kinase [Chitinophaga skermanii]|uniref:Polyphosphate kinase n=1 Tax=Chitinophaga skermanii TaxID=331697 RepID=A0A327QKR9_9BACT|nr:polyphosphate kinase 1 [Chitinophaga skermanii]RAJ04282.1 polyphosphate kinase [Chitinophaga skermanii]
MLSTRTDANEQVLSGKRYCDRDLSWLSFNYLVLKMAGRQEVPLYERIKFLSIFSSNLDEFYRVRISALLAVNAIGDDSDLEAIQLLKDIQTEIARQQQVFGDILRNQLRPLLEEKNVHLYFAEELMPAHQAAAKSYFFNTVLGFLKPMWLDPQRSGELFLENNTLYFAVALQPNQGGHEQYVIVNIPSTNLPRFTVQHTDGNMHILWLDDIVRTHLPKIFPGYKVNGCYAVKLTRNAEIDLYDFPGDLLEQVEELIVQRELGLPTRFLYDAQMPENMLQALALYFHILPQEMVAGGHYHNLKDLNDLPLPLKAEGLLYEKWPAQPVPQVESSDGLLDTLLQQDVLLHTPYHSYNPVLRFFNEAATDPNVTEIYVTLYRVASGSQIVQSLISAARNGKQVTVLVELKARFDEANNIRWAKRMKEAGVKIIYSIPGLKVHAKIALVKRKKGWQHEYFALLATGNLNETTARFYTDHILLTSHATITQEMELLFMYLQTRESPRDYHFIPFKELIVAQFNMVERFEGLIDREIAHVQAGRKGHIIIKLNNLQERKMIDKLYEAADAGVRVELIVRSICCILPGYSPNLTVHRLVDRYLEHGRVFWFANNGGEEMYLGSADWMSRNLYHRIEVCFQLHNPAFIQQMKDMLHLQLADNTNAVILDNDLINQPIAHTQGEPLVNAQLGMFQYVRNLNT